MAEENSENKKIELDLDFDKIIPWNGQQDTGRDVRLKLDRNWQKVVDAFNVLLEYIVTAEYLEKKFLRKDKDDRTPFLLNVGEKLTAEKGIQIGESFIPGILTGHGGFFDAWANGEVESLIIRRFLEVPELRFNRVQVTLGDKWNAPGGGIFESVLPDSDEDGNILMTGTGWLKLEEGEYGAIAVGDICMGIFHSMNSSENATDDSDDSRGNFQFSGFYTCYFTITEITGKENKQFRYQMRPVSDRWKLTYHPRQAMTFVCYGSFTNPSRQTSSYTTRTYYRLLKFQNTWEIGADNIAMQLGDLTNMNVHGLEMSGYSAYLNNIYMTGIIRQFNESGVEIKIANDRGAWKPGTTYAFYDRVSHNGCLWLCVNESGTNTEPSLTDPSWLKQVDSGSGITSSSHWNSANVPYLSNTILTFADKIWISNKTTSEPPFPIYTDSEGNYLQFSDGGYILVSPLIQSEDWDLLLDATDLTNGKNGKDGDSLYVRYSADGTNWHDTFTEGDIYMQQRVGLESLWSDPIRIVGEDGVAKDGRYADYQFAVNDSDTVPPVSGWQDAPPSVGSGQYLWMRMRIVDPNEDTPGAWSIPVRLKGDKGDGITSVGAWKSGIVVPALGVVTMGGISFVAKVATTNPPLWCYTDSEGNYLLFNDGGYILTGEYNTEEYDELVHSGKDGKDGTEHEYIYIHTGTETAPATPNSIQQDDYIPGGWHDDPLGVSESLLYEWVSVRKKENGIWGSYSKPSLWAKYGEDGSNYEFVYIRTSVDEAPVTPNSVQQDDYVPDGWTDDPVGPSQEYPYEWMSRRKKTGSKWGAYSKPTHWTYWAKDGEGFEMMGNWHSGLVVPKLGVVTMGGRIWVAKAATTNPPLWCYTDSKGNYLLYNDGGYILTGECNTEEYDLWVSDGIGSFVSTVFIRSNSTPATPTGGSYDNPVPTGWSDGIPSGTAILWASTCVFRSDGTHDSWSKPSQMTDTANFDVEYSSVENPSAPAGHPNTNSQWSNTADKNTIWMATSTCSNGVWSNWSVSKIKGETGGKGDTGDKGDTGIQGCIYRQTEWVSGTKYHNDTGLTSGLRYIDIVTVTDSSGNFSAYECKATHTAGEGNKPGSGESWKTYWTEMNTMQPIYTPLLLTKNAVMRFGQANQLLVLNDGGNVMAGLSGGSSTNDILLWVGGTPATAPFTVDKNGNMVASKATIAGTIIAEAGSIGGFNIGENYIGNKDLALLNNDLIRISPDRIIMVNTRYEKIDNITYEGQSETVLSPGRLIVTNVGNTVNSLALRARSGDYMLEVTRSGIRISKDGGILWTYLKYE